MEVTAICNRYGHFTNQGVLLFQLQELVQNIVWDVTLKPSAFSVFKARVDAKEIQSANAVHEHGCRHALKITHNEVSVESTAYGEIVFELKFEGSELEKVSDDLKSTEVNITFENGICYACDQVVDITIEENPNKHN